MFVGLEYWFTFHKCAVYVT